MLGKSLNCTYGAEDKRDKGIKQILSCGTLCVFVICLNRKFARLLSLPCVINQSFRASKFKLGKFCLIPIHDDARSGSFKLFFFNLMSFVGLL